MVKDTSLAAFYSSTYKRTITAMQARVLDAIYIHGAHTRYDLSNALGVPINSLCAAVNGLVKAGVLEEFERVKQAHSHKLAWLLRIKDCDVFHNGENHDTKQ